MADSQIERRDANLEAMHNLYDNLGEQGLDLRQMPFVVQYNKRDLPNIAPLGQLECELNPTRAPSFEAVGARGVGVFDTLKAITKQVIKQVG